MRAFVSSRSSTYTDDRRSVVSGNSSNASTLVADSVTSNRTATSQLRKFTAAVGKPGVAREAREAVRNAITTQNPLRVAPIAEPLDYEKFVFERSIQLENDPQRELLLFPRDDVQETLVPPEFSTSVPSTCPEDVNKADWLLTKEAVRLYTSPYKTITFNYGRFAGDYNRTNFGSSLETEISLSSLVFESDMALEEDKAALEGFLLTDVVKEGYVLIGKSDPSILDNLKAVKRRYCILKRSEGGDIVIEVRKSPTEAPKRPPMKVNCAQLKSMKKGKSVLQIEPCPDGNEKNDQKPLILASDEPEELTSWLLNVNRAIAFANKGDSISSCSERLDRSRGFSETFNDSESIASEDSATSRDTSLWRGRSSAARALQPPIVDRRNVFSLYYRLSPCGQPKGEPSCLLNRSRGTTPAGSPNRAPVRRRRSTLLPLANAIQFTAEFEKLDLKLAVTNGQLQQVEPFYVAVFLYDSSASRRISEEFHIDVSCDAIQKTSTNTTVNGISKTILCDPAATKMLFTVTKPHKDVWIVCRIDRMLSADTTADVYMKNSSDPKAVAKYQKTLHGSNIRLGGYRQRFAWAARPVFPELKTGDLNSSNVKESTDMQVYKCEGNKLTEADIQKHLIDFAKFEKSGKLAIPNGSISMKVDLSSQVTDEPVRVNPSWYPLRPWSPTKESTEKPVFELQSFGDAPAAPHAELVNLLYIYPLSLKYDTQKVFSKARNILCNVRFVSGQEIKDNQVMMNRLAPNGPFVSSVSCAVQHHQQCPSFGEEIKMQLPLSFSNNDHLLFSFYHVSVAGQGAVKSPENSEISVGYAWLPLVWKKDKLVLENDEQEFDLPIAADLPAGYLRSKSLGLGKGDENGEVKWVDQKSLFRFRLRIVSSVFTTESKLQTFFQACQRLEAKRLSGDATELAKSRVTKSSSPSSVGASSTDAARSCSPLARSSSDLIDTNIVELVKRTQSLCDVSIDKLIPFLHVILSRLFSLLSKAPTDQLALSTLSSLISICDRTSPERIGLLRAFVRLHFMTSDGMNGEESTHVAVCKYLHMLIKQVQGSIEELAAIYRQLWFFFDIVSKSIAQTVIHKELHKNSRRNRFPAEFVELISSLIETLVPQIIAKHKELPEECRAANTAVTNFVRCCLSFLDRGSVFKWFHYIISRLDEHDSRILREYKTDILTILSQHEHWLPLCLPILLDDKNHIQRIVTQNVQMDNPSTVSTANGSGFFTRLFLQVFTTSSLNERTETDRYACCSEEWHLSKSYCARHFPCGLLFQELFTCLREPRDYRRRAIVIIRNLFAKHSYDKRYTDLNIQNRIAILYSPLIRFAVDHIHELQASIVDSPDSACTGILRVANKWKSLDRRATVALDTFKLVTAASPVTTPQPLAEKLDSEEIEDLILCVVWVLLRLPKRILCSIWTEADGSQSLKLIQLLRIVLTVFQYRGKQEAIEATGKSIRCSNRTIQLLPPSSSRMPSVDLNGTSISDIMQNDDDSSNPLPFGVLQLLNLSQETALIVLDVLQSLSQQLASRNNKNLSCEDSIFNYLLNLHLTLLEDYWSEAVRLHTIAALAVFVNIFRQRLFEGNSLEALALLIENILIQMASRLSTVQNSAAALLQLILRNGYETAQNHLANQAMTLSVLPSNPAAGDSRPLTAAERLGRPGAQTGVALARLLGVKSTLLSNGRFEKGLACLETLVNGDVRKMTVFDKAVLELVRQLRGVMVATVALKDAANDPIRLADLQIQLADSYRGSAALRSAWFDTLAETHCNDRWFSEASVCFGHSVAIIAKELSEAGEIHFDWSLLDHISVEITEYEKAREKERNVQPAGFTVENLLARIEKTAQTLTLAERYEAIGPLYRIVIPVLEQRNNFNALISIYAELQQSYSRAAEVKTSGKRHLGTYFRVRFCGINYFESDHDTEWIYREVGLTSLAEFSIKMKEHCKTILNLENVQVEPENENDISKVPTDKPFVYVTHVDPVVSPGLNPKDFAAHTNISKFSYECPIVEGEKKDREPPIVKQALKRIVLEVKGHFPSCRRRLRVVAREVETFSPLKFACQKLLVKADQIHATLDGQVDGRALDLKGLQLLLQGAVMPTVNAGPLAYAEAFTQKEEMEKYGETGLNELKGAFKSLMAACECALRANQSAVGADQQTYHEVLLSSFEAMHERLQTFFGESLRPSKDDEKPTFPRTAIHILDSIGGVNA